MSKAYLVEIETGLFGLYRNIEVEDPDTGQREKVGKALGPIRLFRKKEGSEQINMRTVHPVSGELLELHDITGK